MLLFGSYPLIVYVPFPIDIIKTPLPLEVTFEIIEISLVPFLTAYITAPDIKLIPSVTLPLIDEENISDLLTIWLSVESEQLKKIKAVPILTNGVVSVWAVPPVTSPIVQVALSILEKQSASSLVINVNVVVKSPPI